MTGCFDPGPARSGLDHIELAFTRWSEFLGVHPPRPMSNSVAAEQSLHANSCVVDLVRWIRAVDDYLQGRNPRAGESPGLCSYVTARADVAGPLDALRYAANKSLHLLTELASAPPVYMTATSHFGAAPPPPPRRPYESVYLWPDLTRLPAGGSADSLDRGEYAEYLARREVDPVLEAAVTWLGTQRP